MAQRVEFWSVLADETGRAVDVDLATGPLPVALPESELGAAVDALLANVFGHTPDGTSFAVRLTGLPGGGSRLVVADRGPGFPTASTAGVLSRGASGAGSSGLGLDIARRAADAAGGALTLAKNPGGGGLVTLDLGPPTAPRGDA